MGNHALLVLWTELAALLFAARLLGALANRIGQPAVAGELTAGLLLGPSVFGHVWPQGYHWIFPASGGSSSLQALVSISLAGLLVSIGAETDLPLIRSLGSAASWVTTVSFVVPAAAGAGVALLLPRALTGPHGDEATFCILVGGAVAISSLPVIAKITSDLGLMRRNVGQLAIATGTVHDAIGFVLVALATGLAGGSTGSGGSAGKVATALVGVAGVSALVLTGGQRAFDTALRWSRRNGPNVAGSLTVCIVGSLAAAAAMQAFGVEGALGAFVAGVALGRSRFQVGRAISVVDSMTTTVFAPLYFAAAGLRVDLGVLGRASIAWSFAALLGVAVVTKFLGAAIGARLARLPGREVAALGMVLNGRGALQVVMATAGLASGVLTVASYTLVILMSVVASLAVPPLLRKTLEGWNGTAEEQERLDLEEQLETNVIVRGQRILLASRGSRSSIVAAEVIAAAWPSETPVTVISIEDPPEGGGDTAEGGGDTAEAGGRRPAVQTALDVLAERTLEHRLLRSDSVVDEILAEANLGYGAVALGAGRDPEANTLLSPVIDQLLVRSPLPLIIVRAAGQGASALPGAFTKILVPVSGTPPARAGLEVACSVSTALGSQVLLAHIVTRTEGQAALPGPTQAPARATVTVGGRPPRRRSAAAIEGTADVVMRAAWQTARTMGVDADVMVSAGQGAGEAILAAAEQSGVDMIALGTTVRHVEGRPFLGHTVEHLLANSEATLVVVALPDQAARLGSVLAETN